MKPITLLLLVLLTLGEISSTSLSIQLRHKSKALARMKGFNFQILSPFEGGVVIFTNFISGFLSQFIPVSETIGNVILEFFDNSANKTCYWRTLRDSYNEINKNVKEENLSKLIDKCEDNIMKKQNKQKEIKERYREIVDEINAEIDKTDQNDIKKLEKLAGAKYFYVMKVDDALMEEKALGEFDCKKKMKEDLSFHEEIIRSLQVFSKFFNVSFGPCFRDLLDMKLKNIFKQIGIDIAKKGLGLLVKGFPPLAVGKIVILLAKLGKKIYDLKESMKNEDPSMYANILGKITGNVFDILTGGLLSRRRRRF